MDFFRQRSIGYDKGRKFHFFRCASKNCKGKGHKGVRRYLDSKDRAATSNLKSHAVRCFGQDLVDSVFENKKSEGRDGSIFAAFACQGQQPVKVSHRAHTAEEARWVFFFVVFAVTNDETQELILRDGVPKTTAHIKLSRTITSLYLWKLGGLEHLFPAQGLSLAI